MCHATLMLGESAIMGSDATPDRYETPKGISITFVPKDATEANHVFKALAKDGNVIMELQETFWAKKFGMLVDQFGVSWMINLEGSKP
jgi:PhnB protein